MARRPNVEEREHAMDAQFHHAHTIWKTDLYDSAQDARSDARYEDDRGEVVTEWRERFECVIDESGGLRGDVRGA